MKKNRKKKIDLIYMSPFYELNYTIFYIVRFIKIKMRQWKRKRER